MERTAPKWQRNSSLSLCRDNNKKRHSASPQTRLRAAQSVAVAAAAAASFTTKLAAEVESLTPPPRSPSATSLDGGIEFTPPNNRKRASILNNNNFNNLDDSIDYSPKAFDMSFSPGCMLSQTLAIESPEVGWRWARRTVAATTTTKHSDPIATPDSAYGADSSFASVSASSSSEAGMAAGRTRGESLRQRAAYERRRDEQCNALELKRQRAEKLRADEMLKRRCAKLQQQLQDAADASTFAADLQKIAQEKEKPLLKQKTDTPVRMNTRFSLANTSASPAAVQAMVVDLSAAPPGNSADQETLDDFFNDSESDCFLLAATQQLESKISATLSRKTEAARPQKPPVTVTHSASAPVVVAAATTPTTSSCKDKRSSFYLQFLEDDSDDWFVSLDEAAIRQASEAKKPRSSFQRYKSLPADTSMTSTNVDSDDESATNPTTSTKKAKTTACVGGGVSKMKRHASSHALSPSSSSYRGRQLHLRK